MNGFCALGTEVVLAKWTRLEVCLSIANVSVSTMKSRLYNER